MVAALLALARSSARGGAVPLFGHPVREDRLRQATRVLAVSVLALGFAVALAVQTRRQAAAEGKPADVAL